MTWQSAGLHKHLAVLGTRRTLQSDPLLVAQQSRNRARAVDEGEQGHVSSFAHGTDSTGTQQVEPEQALTHVEPRSGETSVATPSVDSGAMKTWRADARLR